MAGLDRVPRAAGAASVQARLRAARKSAKFHWMSSFIAAARLPALLSGGLLLLLRLARR
jgi:hypothetical protein